MAEQRRFTYRSRRRVPWRPTCAADRAKSERKRPWGDPFLRSFRRFLKRRSPISWSSRWRCLLLFFISLFFLFTLCWVSTLVAAFPSLLVTVPFVAITSTRAVFFYAKPFGKNCKKTDRFAYVDRSDVASFIAFLLFCFFGHHGVLVGRHRFRCYFLDMLRVPNKIFCKCWLRNLAINRRCLFGHISKWFRRSIEFISVFRGFQRDFEQLVLRWPTSSFRWLPHWFIFEDFSPKKNVDRHSNQLFRRLDLNFSFLFKCSSAFPSADETFL